MSKSKFYITSPIFYPNANLHIGHAYTMTVCDVLARYHRLIDNDVYFLTGSDENSGKVVKVASEKNISVEDLLTTITDNFKKLYTDLDISYDQFIRTTDKERHWPGTIKMWTALVARGDIYKGNYSGLYCIGCESFYTEKELINGKCPIHLTVPEKIEEENYFFKLSAYTHKIKEKIIKHELKIIPETRKNEILAQLERGLEDISFSRPRTTVPHGIPVPNDDTQVMYVWCDALVNYISALGYGSNNEDLFKQFWPTDLHVIGKDILRFHTAIWPAMLISAGLPVPKNIMAHGFITSGGHKMSKSLNNVIDPYELISTYGKDAVRYYFARHISPFEDGDLTMERFKNVYNADLANGLGNLVSRIMKMATSYQVSDVKLPSHEVILHKYKDITEKYCRAFELFESHRAADFVWERIAQLDEKIQTTQPFKLIKTDQDQAINIVKDLVSELWIISTLLIPFMPETAFKIKNAIEEQKMPPSLFQRKD